MNPTIVLAALLFSFAAGAKSLPPVKTVDHVDLKQYLGRWYEIASYPQNFQEGCVASTADYSLKKNGDIQVINQCRMHTLDGEINKAVGVAKVVDRQTNAKLKVTFFWPFYGKYWIIDLADDYRYAVVGHPDRTYLWILSRAPSISQNDLAGILERLENQKFDLAKLRYTTHRN
jgi:apolipoprotein D and lipocalin family protein